MDLIVEVEVEGLTVELEVTGELYPEEETTREHPGGPGGFEVSSIKVNGTELFNDLPSAVVDRIALMAMEDILDAEA